MSYNFNSFLKNLSGFFCGITLVFLFSVIPVQCARMQVHLAGYVYDTNNSPRDPVPNMTLLVKYGFQSESASADDFQYEIIKSDGSGHYSTTVSVFCKEDGYAGGDFGVKGILANGRLSGGGYEASGGLLYQCTSQDFSHTDILVEASPPYNAQNLGGSCPIKSVGMPSKNAGEPVNVTNGNMWLLQNDYNLPGIGENINVTRTYNSLYQATGLFGFGWTSNYDEKLYFYDDTLTVKLSDGRHIAFIRQDNTYTNYGSLVGDFFGRVVRHQDVDFDLIYKDGRIDKFDIYGKLISRIDRNGNRTILAYNSDNRLVSVTDPVGRTLNITPNVDGLTTQISDSTSVIADYEYYPYTQNLKTITYHDGSKRKFEYTNILINGVTKTLLTTVKDALDNILETHQYDSGGRATTSEKSGGVEKYTLDYAHLDDAVPYTTVTDANQKITKYWYDKAKGVNVVTKIQGLCGCGSGSEVTNFEYDDQLNLTKKTDALGYETVSTYDANGNRLTMTDVLGTENYTYNALGEMLTRTDRMGGVWTNTFDTKGNLLTAKDALNNTTTATYTALGQLATVKDALNQTTTLTYDAFGRLTQVKDANNKTTNYAYDARARLTGATNAINETTNYEYDLNNRLKKVIFADANFVTMNYDIAGRRTALTDARGNATNYAYDAAYRLTSMTDALNHTMSYGYDAMSNPTAQTDALGNVTNYEYDDFNRLKKTIYPAATAGAARLQESVTYDTVGNVKTRIDTAGRTTNYDYDTAQRLTKTTDALNEITQFEYNPRSQMTKVTDAANQVYQFSYDALGRQLSQTRANATMSYEYDAVGNRTKRTDYNGKITSYEYDTLNRLKKINYLTGADNTVTGDVSSYNYDDLSRLTSAVNQAGTVAFTYDTRGRVKTTTDVFGHLLNYGYDANGNRNLLKLDGTTQTSYAYDAANRLTTLTDEASQNFTFGYDIANRLISKALPNGVSTSYDYDGMSRLKELKHRFQTTPLFDYQYAYNPANQIGQITEPDETRNFTYDNLDRLTGAVHANNGELDMSYGFDAVGNRISTNSSELISNPQEITFEANNRLTQTEDGTNYDYDASGNLTAKSPFNQLDIKWAFVWDYENRMISATGSQPASLGRTIIKTASYSYDALGRRVTRTDPAGSITKFTYDGMDVVMDDDTISGITKYQNGLGIDDKLKVSINGTAKYFITDHLGSTVGLTDASGNVSSSAIYDSFGNSTNNLSTRYQYTGREFDNFTGLQYSRARWYDAKTGRFISEDPIGFRGGDVNLYGYVWNNAGSLIDPSGLDGCSKGKCGHVPQIPDSGEPPRRPPPFLTQEPTPHPTPFSTPTPSVTSQNGTSSQCSCTESPYQSSSPGTFQIGVGVSGILGVVPVVFGGGIAIDTSGNVGLYYEGGSGAGIGADFTAGLQLSATNANNIKDLGGPFVNPTIALGDVIGGSGNLIFGNSDSGPIVGAGVLLGAGAGAEYGVTGTLTGVTPLFNVHNLFGGKNGCK